MWEIKYTLNGVLGTMQIPAPDPQIATRILTCMYGSGNLRIIDVVRRG